MNPALQVDRELALCPAPVSFSKQMVQVVLAVIIAVCGLFGPATAAEKRNVLFLISDDLRTEVGCYGSPLAQTPNIDALSAAGVRFDRAYCQYPLCCPSRTSMLTGRQPVTTGVYGNRTWFGHEHPDYVSLPTCFKQNGYATLRAGKIFHGGIDDPEAWTEGGEQRVFDVRTPSSNSTQGEPAEPRNLPQDSAEQSRSRRGRPMSKAEYNDRWVVLPGEGRQHGDYRVADRAIAYLEQYRDQPFFLACGFSKPHSPLVAPKRFFDLYRVEDIELPPDFAPRPTVPSGFPVASIRPRNADLFIGRDASPEEAKAMIRGYLASTSWMDWNLGRVVAALDRLGLRDSTIIVFWGDHGFQLGEKGKWSKAASLFEQGARVPLIIVDPGAAGNGTPSSRVVESIDIYPTLVELCGLPRPAGLEGHSLVPLLEDPDAAWDYPAYTVWSENGKTLTGISVRTERWRYTEFFHRGGGALLFDENNDPHEMYNLADDPKYASVRAELSKLVQQYKARESAAD